MDIDVFAAKDLDTVFSVLRTALRHSGPLTPRERRFLAACARITGYALPKSDPIALIAAEVHLAGEQQRKRLVQLAALAALLNNPVTDGSARFLKELSWRLHTHDPVVGVVEAVEKGQHFRARVLAGLFLRSTSDDGYDSAVLGILAGYHGIGVTHSVSTEILASFPEIAA